MKMIASWVKLPPIRRSWGAVGFGGLLLSALLCGAAACNPKLNGPGQPDLAIPPSPDLFFDGPYSDLPKGPVGAGGVTGGTLGGIAGGFGSAPSTASGGPCITEPTFGALYPTNFTSPLIEWTPVGGQNIFELRFHIANQVNDLLVYTDGSSYTLPATMWAALAQHSADKDIQLTIRGGQQAAGKISGSVAVGSSGAVHIAPVPALGAIVYWTSSDNTALKGFHIGDASVVPVLSPASVTTAGDNTSCVGCHTSSPDGLLAFFGRAQPSFAVDTRMVDGSSKAPLPSQVTQNALTNLARTDQNMPVLSPAHYSSTDAVVVTVMNSGTNGRWELIYTDLHAQSGGTGIIPRTGDSQGAGAPAWSQDGATLAYTSSNAVVDGRLDQGVGQIWTVPYNQHQGGQATPLPGVNDDPSFNQYYPIYSPADTFLAFNRNAAGANMYNSPSAEVYIAPAKGGTPVRLPANDPPMCSGVKSPGLTNSWARWSPGATLFNGKHYYWLVFSSDRRPSGNPQLYLSGVVTVDMNGSEVLESTYPAIYITTQPADQNNHTPAWDKFMIQPIG